MGAARSRTVPAPDASPNSFPTSSSKSKLSIKHGENAKETDRGFPLLDLPEELIREVVEKMCSPSSLFALSFVSRYFRLQFFRNFNRIFPKNSWFSPSPSKDPASSASFSSPSHLSAPPSTRASLADANDVYFEYWVILDDCCREGHANLIRFFDQSYGSRDLGLCLCDQCFDFFSLNSVMLISSF